MAVAAQDIITDARNLLQDNPAVRWTDTELLAALNAGQLEIVSHKPEANAVNTTAPLVAGIKQTIPADGVQLIKIIRNANGGGIRLVEMDALTEFNPDWPDDKESKAVRNYMFDRRDPTHFYVYPQQPSAAGQQGSVELVYSQTPAVISDIANNISLHDIYRNALMYFVCFRAMAKETDIAGSAQKALAYYQTFESVLGIRTQAETVATPNKDQ